MTAIPLAATLTRRRDPVPRHADPLAPAALCAACPKLCRPACPVESATGRESVAPWRISAAIAAGPDATTAVQVASCTGCGACAEACLAGVNLPEQSRAARAVAPRLPAAVAVAARIAATGSPRRSGTPELAAGSDPAAATALWFGCTVQQHDPATGRAARELFARAGEPVRCAGDEPCCGAVAVDLGLRAEAAALAARAAASLAGAERVVVLSPGCARAMREEWPGLGVAAPPVVTAPEWLDATLARGALVPAPAAATTVAWHDPCTLARGLGVTEAPRRVLAALGVTVAEPAATGRDTRCSGGGAAYPLVDPAGAGAVTEVRRAELAALGAPVVTACPEAARRLGGTDLLPLAVDRLVAPEATP